jgi:ATP-dependent Clp protease ATP-binding subunit ClpC
MFDRYSERARRTLFFARYELGQLGGATIEPAHVLLGLLRDSKGIRRLLAARNIPLAELRSAIEQHVTGGEQLPSSIEVPFAAATIRVLKFAAEEADRLLNPGIEPEHLLLGLLRENDPVAAAPLNAYGVGLDGTRETVALRSGGSKVPTAVTDLVESVSPLAAVHVERIMKLVRDLAQTEPNSAAGRTLVGRVDDELMMLTQLLD